ncbi:period circadian protein homolog 3-like isoform X2 [Conger conger]|uniref:period circadian protein homolog 3-like isoform X2 n=1 Tax=Conger conger TaxID=82655 RepID=UPI002A59E8B9|nr:period circadian protein homolog 3-like isoform X2 [Conger conger]
MPRGGSFNEGEEEEEGDEVMDSSSVPGGGGGGGRGGGECPERVLGDEEMFAPGIESAVVRSKEAGQSDGAESSSNHSSQSATELDCSTRSKLRPHAVSSHTESSGSEQPGQERAQSHRQIMRAMREMKKSMPSERKGHRKTRTVDALRYALSCVKRVQASTEYHQLLLGNLKEERSVSPTVCSLEELERVASEHTLKNTDTFAVVFSLTSGRVLYVSEQASSILGLKSSFLTSVRFVELLYQQDVNVFYSHTGQAHLPPWVTGPHHKAELYESNWVKSFFCRLRGGKDSDGEVRYSPFRITPYLLQLRGGQEEQDLQPCCLALAERVHSGYEAPRIPLEKRIFTTTHSPGCAFMEVDDRAVPLLGYLPHDLIGSSVLACLHPEDRPLMLSLHHKILKYAGQRPFEYSPLRLRCQNGDYVTLDTSWSSFINPWSRKVAFVIGRHKVRTGPLNEDVFAKQSSVDPGVPEEIQELQTQIYRLFLQPVYNKGSSGYGSMGSNGSHEQYVSMSSSDSNGNQWEEREPRKLGQVCSDIHKSWGQRGCKLPPTGRCLTAGPTAPPPASRPMESGVGLSPPHKDSRKQHHIPSYQQINCVDSIIRYLESYTVPPQKRKSEAWPMASSSSSEEEQTRGCAMVVGRPLPPPPPARSVTSQCSYSSTIVHVPQPESEVTALEDAPMSSEPAAPAPPPAPAARPQPSARSLTKELLSAHTQREEQEYVGRLRHRILRSPYRGYLQHHGSSPGQSQQHGNHGEQEVGGACRRKLRVREPTLKRRREQWSSDSYTPPPEGPRADPSPLHPGVPSETYTPSAPLYPAPLPYQGFQAPPSAGGVLPTPGAGPYMPPMMAVVLPNFPPYPVYPQGAGLMAPSAPYFIPPFSQSGFGPTFPGFGPSPSFPAFPGPALVPQAPPPAPVPAPAAAPPAPSPALSTEVDPTSQLFSSSRSSSPLQLNLLQEELPKPAQPPGPPGGAEIREEAHRKGEEVLSDSGNHDNQSTSSEVMELLLQEDAHSRTGSNASGSRSGESGGSLGAGSNGTSTSNTGSGDSSLYFGSSDSSHTSPPASRGQSHGEQVAQDRANFERCVGNSLWSLIQRTPEPVMMTYQIAPRDQAEVLREDREKLLLLAPMQPVFTKAQREELEEVHSWMKEHSLPQEINTQGCLTCEPTPSPASPCPPQDPSLDT